MTLALTIPGEQVFAPITAAGTPRGPVNGEAQRWAIEIERILEALGLTNGGIYPTLLELNADLSHPANTGATVLTDPIAANRGIYRKVGASGSGSWEKLDDLPKDAIIELTNTGGTNVITATSAEGINPSGETSILDLRINVPNGGPVQLNVDNIGNFPLVLNGGGDLPPNYFVAGSNHLLKFNGTEFRLYSEGSGAAIQAAAELARNEAEVFKDQTAGLANTLIDPQFATIAAASAFSPPFAPEKIRTMNYEAGVAGGGTEYNAVAIEPAHSAKFSITLDDGTTVQWYEAAGPELTPEMIGHHPDGVARNIDLARQAADAIGGILCLGVGEYKTSVTLRVHDNTVIHGKSRKLSIIQGDDIDVMGTNSADLVSEYELKGFRLKGNANKSTSTGKFVGFRMGPSRDAEVDIAIENTVDGYDMNAGSTGLINIRGHIHVFNTQWPNPVNTSPRRMAWLRGTGGKKPQTIKLETKLYGNGTGRKFSGTVPTSPAAIEADFTLPLPLYRFENFLNGLCRGIALFIVDANGFPVQTTDFQLFDMTSGAPVEITSGWINPWDPAANAPGFPSVPVDLRVVFGASVPEGSEYTIMYIDPWAEIGLYIQNGSGNEFTGEIGGAHKAVLCLDQDNNGHFVYTQINSTDFDVRALNCEFWSIENNNTTILRYDVDAAAKRLQVSPFLGQLDDIVLNEESVVSDVAVPIPGASGGQIIARDHYEMRYRGDARVSVLNEHTSDVTVVLRMMRNRNSGIPANDTALDTLVFDIAASEEKTVYLRATDDQILGKSNGIIDRHSYYLDIRTTSGAFPIKVLSNSNGRSVLSVDRVPAYQQSE